MEVMGPIRGARTNFTYFAQRLQTDPHDVEFNYLQEWFAQWLERGDGVAMTGGSYETWLRVVVDIADGVMQHEVSLDYIGTPEANYADRVERSVVGIHHHEYSGQRYLDRS